jgi:hypothetical protein
VGEVGDRVGRQGTANAGMLRPAVHAALGGQRITGAGLTRSCSRAASHSCGDTIGGVFMACCPSFRAFSGDVIVVIATSELERSLVSSGWKRDTVQPPTLAPILVVAAPPLLDV